jgi:hypothetical protein
LLIADEGYEVKNYDANYYRKQEHDIGFASVRFVFR